MAILNDRFPRSRGIPAFLPLDGEDTRMESEVSKEEAKSIDVLEDGLTDESRVNCQDVEGRDSSGQGSSKKKSSATRGKVSFEKKNLAPRVF